MNRRDFIKGMTLSLLAAAVPAGVYGSSGKAGMQRHEEKKIKIIGIGTGGAIVTRRLLPLDLKGVELVLVDRDPSTIERSPVKRKHLLSPGFRRCGEDYDPKIGFHGVDLDREGLKEIIKGAEHVIFVSYIGGNTGSGALPPLIELTDHTLGIKCSAVVSTDFTYTAQRSNRHAIESIKHKVDELVVIDNDWINERWDNCKKCPVYADPRIHRDAAYENEHCGRCNNAYSVVEESEKIDDLMVARTMEIFSQKKAQIRM